MYILSAYQILVEKQCVETGKSPNELGMFHNYVKTNNIGQRS